MKIGVVGTGYVGLVTGTCFAEMGNEVLCVDIDADKVARLQNGEVPIYEPGLEDLFNRNQESGRLTFTTNLTEAMGSAAIFLALPTPPGADGAADLSYILGAAEDIGKLLDQKKPGYTVVVDKSTVPVGTARLVAEQLAKHTDSQDFDVVSNPEFLREGQAVADFMKPDRIVIGTESEKAEAVMRKLYRPFVRQDPDRLTVTDPASAELIKYAANGFLATKITFVNELTRLCEEVGADIDAVREGMGSDSRIGPQFLYAGPGYGGSCFPKDTSALYSTGQEFGVDLKIVEATIAANERQKKVVVDKVVDYFEGDLEGKTIALWGLAFKDNTDDIRESPALVIVEELTKKGATVRAFDPQAMDNVRKQIGDNQKLEYADDEYEALEDADALVIATNWREFNEPDFNRMLATMNAPVIIDGRNIYSLEDMEALDFYYESIGRRTIDHEV